ncbi:MAG: TonB-dependent receptor, partial [Alphaproteobacteria bacterium]|nr:TonB-dependent receptor [Alphaproteobacteria bacterium]
MKLKLLAGVAMAAAFAASGASAQEGWYGAVDLGYHWPDGIDATSSNNAANGIPYNWDFNQKDDWAGFARLGYQLNDHWRVELEVGYRSGDIDSVRGGSNQAVVGLCTPGVTRTTGAPVCGAPDGDVSAWTVMGNVIYDILPGSVLNPYIGAGIGANHVKMDVTGQFSNVPAPVTAANAIQNLTVDDSDTAFAYQLIAGLAWKATDQLSVDLTYRYLAGSDLDFTSTGSLATGLQPGVFSGEYKDQSVTLGLRYLFAAPPPP